MSSWAVYSTTTPFSTRSILDTALALPPLSLKAHDNCDHIFELDSRESIFRIAVARSVSPFASASMSRCVRWSVRNEGADSDSLLFHALAMCRPWRICSSVHLLGA
eukprot:scaffold15972_cov73-Cyclotella_meneghiniana.AAC.8